MSLAAAKAGTVIDDNVNAAANAIDMAFFFVTFLLIRKIPSYVLLKINFLGYIRYKGN